MTSILFEGVSSRLAVLLIDVMEAVENSFASFGIELPERHVIVAGQPVHDCEQVTVQMVQAYYGLPGAPMDEPQPCPGPMSAVLSIQVVRKLPVLSSNAKAISAEKVSNAALVQVTDAFALLQSVEAINQFDGLLPIADVTIPDPSGDLGGPVLNVTVAVP